MMVTFLAHYRCSCDSTREAFMIATVRVNKRSLRLPGNNLVAWSPCRTCDTDGTPTGLRWALSPEDAKRVEAYRLRRWPELANERQAA